jgi:hypothetical protein
MPFTTPQRQRIGWGVTGLLYMIGIIVLTLAGLRQVETASLNSGQVSLSVAPGEVIVQAAATPVGDDGAPDRNIVPLVDQATDDWRATRQLSSRQVEPAHLTTWTVVDDMNAVCDE